MSRAEQNARVLAALTVVAVGFAVSIGVAVVISFLGLG